MDSTNWGHAFEDGAMFKRGDMGEGTYVDPAFDFRGMYFGPASNDEDVSGIDRRDTCAPPPRCWPASDGWAAT